MKWDLIGIAISLLTWLFGPEVPTLVKAALYALSAVFIAYGVAPAVLAKLKPRRRRAMPVAVLCIGVFISVVAIYWMWRENQTPRQPDTNFAYVMALSVAGQPFEEMSPFIVNHKAISILNVEITLQKENDISSARYVMFGLHPVSLTPA